MNYDALIIGAGIVGAACAARLAEEGLRCAVVDKAGPASGATAAAMGHVVVMDDSEAQYKLTSYSQKLWQKLAPELPPEAEHDPCGTIWVAADDEEMAEVARKRAFFFRHRSSDVEILDERTLREAEPNLREGLAGGLLVRGDSVAYQPFVTEYLLQKAKTKGCELLFGKAVQAIKNGSALVENKWPLNAKFIVNAAGTGAPRLTPALEIAPRKGHLAITDRYPGFVRHQLIELGYLKSAHGSDEDSVAFNAQPRSTGQILLGSSRQFGVTDALIDHALLRRMTARAFEYMPGLRNLTTLRVWTGFRPATPDNLPYIGRDPNNAGVFVAAGHEGLGVTTSLGTAELICDEILGRDSAIPREPYRVGRSAKHEH